MQPAFPRGYGLIAALLALPIPRVSAQVFDGPGLQSGVDSARGLGGISGQTDLASLVVHVATLVLNFVTLLAVVGVIVAGLYLILGQGEDSAKEKAKKIIIYIVVGLLIILLARVIVLFVNSLIV